MTPVPGTRDACPQLAICGRRFDELERKASEQDKRWNDVWQVLTTVQVKIAALDGRLAGYLVAASLLGGIVAFLAQHVFGK